MNEWKPIFLGARRNLVTLSVVAALCVGAVVAIQMFGNSLNAQVLQLGSAVQQQRGQLNQKQDDLRNVRSHIARFELLRSQGLMGTPDRPLWVEELLASHGRLKLSTPLAYQLQMPKTVVDANTAPSSVSAAPDATSEEPLVHDLQFEMREVHEGDVLRLIQDFQANVKGRFRVNACTFSEAQVNGMTAQCVLRFVTIPVATAAKPAN